MLHPMFDQLDVRHTRQAGVHLIYVDQMHVYGYAGQRQYFSPLKLVQVALGSAISLARWATRLRPDVVHVAKPQPINGLAGLLSLHSGATYLDCDDYETAANRFGGSWQQWGVRWWDDHMPLLVDGVSVNTHFSFERCTQLGVEADKITYVPNGISDWHYERFHPHHVQALKAALALDAHPTILYAGDINITARGIGLLLEAFALLLTRVPSARLLMVGDGDDRLALHQQTHQLGIASAVRWTGRVPPQSIRAYLAMSDCSVDPVYNTPAMRGRSPLKIFESMALSIPVVTGDVGDRRDILADGQAGVLVEPGDAAALAAGLEHVLTDRAYHARLASESLQRSEDFRWERLVRQWETMYG